jgi:hypothetical protein
MFNVSICFGHYLPILRRHHTNVQLVTVVCSCRCVLVPGYGKAEVFPYPETNPHLQLHTSHQFCIRVVLPKDGQVIPETCRDIEHQSSVSESEVCISWLCYYLITSLWCTVKKTLKALSKCIIFQFSYPIGMILNCNVHSLTYIKVSQLSQSMRYRK